MNQLFIVFAIVVAIMVPGCQTQTAQVPGAVPDQSKAGKPNVLVELFTSEGCSSCPPADRLLTTLDKEQLVDGVEVITLGFHVDYWDHGGWRDKFSSAEFTRRQEAYAHHFDLGSNYTPQAVIDGSLEAVGSNREKVTGAISTRAAESKAVIAAEIVGDKLRIDLSGVPAQRGSTVYLATAENGLVSSVNGGENSGRQLAHVSVVREMQRIGKLGAGQTSSKFEAALPVNSSWKTANLRYVIFVQDNSDMRILGVKRISR